MQARTAIQARLELPSLERRDLALCTLPKNIRASRRKRNDPSPDGHRLSLSPATKVKIGVQHPQAHLKQHERRMMIFFGHSWAWTRHAASGVTGEHLPLGAKSVSSAAFDDTDAEERGIELVNSIRVDLAGAWT